MSEVRLSLEAMATRFEILLHGSDLARLRPAGEEALEEIRRVEAQINRFSPASELSVVNARAALEPVRLDPRLFSLLVHAKQIWQDTLHLFDITIGPLMRVWKFADGGGVPSKEELAVTRGGVGMDLLHLDADALTVSFDLPGVELDLGAIGKGYAIERAADLLREAGISCSLIHGGTSTAYAIGTPESGPWRIAIADPRSEGSALGSVVLRDSALSVSGPHGRSFQEGDQSCGHVLDPRTGEPAQKILAAVVGPSPTVCDALSTALLVSGDLELLRRFGGYEGIVVSAGQVACSLHLAGSLQK